MNRSFCTAVALCVVSAFAAAAVAQDSIIFLDVRNNEIAANTASNYNAMSTPATMNGPFLNDAPAGTGGKRGGGQMLRLNPKRNNGYHAGAATSFPNLDGDGNRATGDLWVYMDVINDASGTNGVISSVGLDFDLTFTGTTSRFVLESVSFTMANDGRVLDSIANPAATPWNGVANGTASGIDWNDARAVAVPVTTGPAYSSTNRLTPRFANIGAWSATSTVVPYRLGRLTATAANRVCGGTPGGGMTGAPDANHANNSTFNVFMQVDSLLITRVYETGGDTIENVSFGINAGGSPDAPQSGNVPNVSSAVADAQIQIREKGDFTGDGRITSADTTGYNAAVADGTDNILQAYCGDFTSQAVLGTIGNLVTSADTTGYNAALAGWSGTICP